MYPDDPAGSLPCTRCGHTLWQHSTGECDIKGCECKGWCASLPAEPADAPWWWLPAVWWVCLGVLIGWLAWGAWL
jgi:hypothetical protein